jgi:nitroimidazol reductase NimA-like FMN-containing flavoprotein (pyridoxamine 5'-phosphate oxidase superfamily)
VTQANPAALKAELDAAEEILRTATLTRLAYNGADGTPRVIPMGFVRTGGAVVVATHPTAPKVAALRARPRVEQPAPPYSAVFAAIFVRSSMETSRLLILD